MTRRSVPVAGVGIVGRKRAGKDTAALTLIREFGFTRVGFADALKELALATDPPITTGSPVGLADVVGAIGWERAKDEWSGVRRTLQRLGTGARNVLGVDVWLRAFDLRAQQVAGPLVVPDVRFPNEADHLRAHGFVILRIDRTGTDAGDMHVSETELEHIRPDYQITNDSTVDALAERVRDLVRNLHQ